MKSVLALAALLLVVFGAKAAAPHERGIMDSVYEMNQIGKINAGYLNAIDMEIFALQGKFESEVGSLGDTDDLMEGKIRATLINMIESELGEIASERAKLDSDNDIIDSDVKPIYEKIEHVDKLIDDLNP